ncbi:MAG: threonine synthase [Acidobacteriota bacterium]
MSFVRCMKCRECGREVPVRPQAICEGCFGPLELKYDYEAIGRAVRRSDLANRPASMWRYRELLPTGTDRPVGEEVGFTPLVPAPRLGKALGIRSLFLKNDAVNFPTLSFKDRVVSVALTQAREFGFKVVGCASTGNLANAVAAQGVRAGFETYILVPEDLETLKIIGTAVFGSRLIAVRGDYDQVNRLCSEIAFTYSWGLVNVNLRAFYAEGSKTQGFEIAEQLGWKLPAHVVVPMAGGALIGKVAKAFEELSRLGWVDERRVRFHGAQASGCAPITTAVKQGWDEVRPVRAHTIARSLAIGNPADGYYAMQLIRSSGGWGEDATDEELVDGIRLLAETEGIFSETAGGVTVAVARKLVAQGRIGGDGPVVLCITGNGLKTAECVASCARPTATINPRLEEFRKVVDGASGNEVETEVEAADSGREISTATDVNATPVRETLA